MANAELIAGLNADMNLEIEAVLRYSLQCALAGGWGGEELREFLIEEIPAELKHVQFFADKIVALGGKPEIKITVPTVTDTDTKAMLKTDLELERGAVEQYKQRIAQADAAGEVGLRVRLEEIAAEETEHMEELQRLLR